MGWTGGLDGGSSSFKLSASLADSWNSQESVCAKIRSTTIYHPTFSLFGCLSNSQAHELMQCLQTFVAQPQSADSQAQSLSPAAPPLEIQPASKDDKVLGTPPTSPTSHGQEEENDRTTQDELSAAKWHWQSNGGRQQLHDGSMR